VERIEPHLPTDVRSGWVKSCVLSEATMSAFPSCGHTASLAFAALCQNLTHAVQQNSNHSITSSARPSRGSGTVSPSALAVFRLMASSIFVTW
jgi:hypothetical protein